MAVFAIGDLHLATECGKPMDVFEGWNDYVGRILENWREQVSSQDTVVLVGDISWGMTLAEAKRDFELIDSLPGNKVLIKGNHDYWWSSRKKMEDFFASEGLKTLSILHNSCVCVDAMALCGTRGWMLEEGKAHDRKLTAREEGRLRTSLECARRSGLPPVAFLHYPPIFGNSQSEGVLSLLLEYGVKQCYYGHLHGAARSWAFEKNWMGIDFCLISADHLRFRLKKI